MKSTKLNFAAFAVILGLTAGLGACDNADTGGAGDEAPTLESPAAPGVEPGAAPEQTEPGAEESPMMSPMTSP